MEKTIRLVLKEMKCPKTQIETMTQKIEASKTPMTQLEIAIKVAKICLAEVAKTEFNATVKDWNKLAWEKVVNGETFGKKTQWRTIPELKEWFKERIPRTSKKWGVRSFFESGVLQKNA